MTHTDEFYVTIAHSSTLLGGTRNIQNRYTLWTRCQPRKAEKNITDLDAQESETALSIVEEAEVLVGLLNADDVHEAAGVLHVGADPAHGVHEQRGLAKHCIEERIRMQ